MMCGEWEAQLNAYVDGTLTTDERSGVDTHLADCAGCRAAVAQLLDLAARAAALPRNIEPPVDLWADIAHRIAASHREAKRWWHQRAVWGGALAAAASFVIALSISRVLALRDATNLSPTGRWAAAEAGYDRAADELAQALAAARARLRPETVALLERNLRLIETAIRESRAALARDSGDADLRALVHAAYREKVELLRWALATTAS